jgi:hypothetical protein
VAEIDLFVYSANAQVDTKRIIAMIFFMKLLFHDFGSDMGDLSQLHGGVYKVNTLAGHPSTTESDISP